MFTKCMSDKIFKEKEKWFKRKKEKNDPTHHGRCKQLVTQRQNPLTPQDENLQTGHRQDDRMILLKI